MKPFVKWVGGKAKVVPQLKEIFPDSFNNYFEPFVGGGAVFFSIDAQRAVLNDFNASLSGTYINIRDNVKELIIMLKSLENSYLDLSPEEQKDMYYEVRGKYNAIEDKFSLEKSALLIFLNKTCFNGMYRENRKGEFNVPFGKHCKPTICDEVNLLETAKRLKNVQINAGSYDEAVKSAKEGDFVYFDPPYHPLTKTSSFTSYTGDDFNEEDQRKLKEVYDSLTKRGCKVVLSNSDSEFIRNLYKEYRQERVQVGRSINAVGSGRGKISELVVLNY